MVTLNAVWDRYVSLAQAAGEEVPSSFISRRSTFKDAIQKNTANLFQFYQPLDKPKEERHMLLIPTRKVVPVAATQMSNDPSDSEVTVAAYEDQEDNTFFRELVHVALRLRAQLRDKPGLDGLDVSQHSATNIIPRFLHIFLSLLCGDDANFDDIISQEVLNQDDSAEAASSTESRQLHDIKVTSLAQDIVYISSKGKKNTPKHIGLALSLHQQTRSRKLVDLFNRCGHCVSYSQLLCIDNALAELTLQSLDLETGAVTPPNFRPRASEDGTIKSPIIQFTADNIDLMMDTLDGKKTFHATQMVAYQRGSMDTSHCLRSLQPNKYRKFAVPDILKKTLSVSSVTQQQPVFKDSVNVEWYEPKPDSNCIKSAKASDFVFLCQRQDAEVKCGWKKFNFENSNSDLPVTAVGYLPLVLHPAHDLNTLYTVVKRCISIANTLNQNYVVLTVDQDLYYRLFDLKSNIPELQERLVLKMGGLHISLNYQKAIGQHMADSGLMEIWVESGIVAPGSADKALLGKAYNKAMRLHKLSYQALWRILMPLLLLYIEQHDESLSLTLKNITVNAVSDALSLLLDSADNFGKLSTLINDFVSECSVNNPNFAFWWEYLEIVSNLLIFTRSLRKGNWDLYLWSLPALLPLIARYDHQHYLKSMAVFIADMNQLPEEIEEAFRESDFVVKHSPGKFNQVDADQAQEWLVGDGKGAGGLVGITNDENALQKWALSFHWRTDISKKTADMMHLSEGHHEHNEFLPSRQKRDQTDEDLLLKVFQAAGVFSKNSDNKLQNLITKDIATPEITDSLLKARALGIDIVKKFVSERLVGVDNVLVKFHEPMKKCNAKTFAHLYKKLSTKPACVKAQLKEKEDRDIMKRIIVAYESGRPVDLVTILRYETCSKPISLAELDGTMRKGDKASLVKLITENITIPTKITLPLASLLVIDAQAMIQAIGNPKAAKTFGDFANIVKLAVKKRSQNFSRVDVVFDRYRDSSTKGGTRQHRTKSARPIRKTIEGRNVPMPVNWQNFIALPENKADLANFISCELAETSYDGLHVVIGGGFREETKVVSSKNEDVSHLESNHEEADTRIVFHALCSGFDSVVVSARDTDIILLLIHHFHRFSGKELWVKTGTEVKPKYIPIHEIVKTLSIQEKENILAFHAITGCDVTSFLATITKRAAWDVFKCHFRLLNDFGSQPLTDKSKKNAEVFIVKLYKVKGNDVHDCNTARYRLFGITKKPEALPPTSDAAHLHIQRAHLQTVIWKNAHIAKFDAPDPTQFGWEKDETNTLKPIWTTIGSVPTTCLELISCKCKLEKCQTNRCKCRGARMDCTRYCQCIDCTNE